jgi:hypothetical protein
LVELDSNSHGIWGGGVHHWTAPDGTVVLVGVQGSIPMLKALDL